MSLYLLQNIDLKIDQLNFRLHQIDLVLSDHSEENQILKQLELSQLERQVCEKSLSDIENKINTTRIKLQQSESSLYGGKIHNPKELQDLETEINLLKNSIKLVEEQQFEIMLNLEKKTNVQSHLEADLTKLKEDYLIRTQSLNTEILDIQKAMDKNQVERNALIGPIDPISIQVYNNLRQTKTGIAVTQVDENTCEKCGAEVTQAVWQKARISNDLCFCGTCGRIIYGK